MPGVFNACGRSVVARSVDLCLRIASNQHMKRLQTASATSARVTQSQQRTAPIAERVTEHGLKKMNLRSSLTAALQEAEISSLTEIQEKAIPAIRDVKNVLIASHTGSGKTYAYLLPIIERLKNEEEIVGTTTPLRTKRPRALVLGPTRELTDQILQVAKSLSYHAKFCSMVLNAGVKPKTLRRNLALHQDLLVATPAKFLEHFSAENVFLGDVQTLVLDEADTMFDEKFFPEIQRIVQILKRKRTHCQFILVAATATRRVKGLMRNLIPDLEIIQTDTLHKGVSGTLHQFVTMKPGQDKIRLLVDVMSPDVQKKAKILIFCNTLSSCRCIEHDLQERDIASICYHGEVPKKERREIIEQFSDPDSEEHVLVCTDVAARGLDIPGRVDHVIHFDFPKSPLDYLHRSGRTARAGATGKVTSLVTGKNRVLADRIKWSVEHDLPLDELSSKKSILPPSLRPKSEDVRSRKGVIKKKGPEGLGSRNRAKTVQKYAETKRLRRASTQQRTASGRNTKTALKRGRR